MTAKEWKERVKRCQASGKTAKAWCRANEIQYHTYLKWAKRFRQEDNEAEGDRPERELQWINVSSPIKTETEKEKENIGNMTERNAPYQKYVNCMPLYRQEKDWVNNGVIISRATLANWVIYVSFMSSSNALTRSRQLLYLLDLSSFSFVYLAGGFPALFFLSPAGFVSFSVPSIF